MFYNFFLSFCISIQNLIGSFSPIKQKVYMTNFNSALKHDSTWDDLKLFLNNLLPKVLIYFTTSFMFSGFHSLCYRCHLGLLVQYFKMPFPLLVGWMLLNLLFSFGNCWCYILPLCERFWYWVDVSVLISSNLSSSFL